MNETEIGIFLGQNLSKKNLDKASSLEQDCLEGKFNDGKRCKCPDGQSRSKFNAKQTCKHNFELIKEKDEIKLKKSYGGEILNANNFCLTNYSGNGIFDRTAIICMDDIETAKEKEDKRFK